MWRIFLAAGLLLTLALPGGAERSVNGSPLPVAYEEAEVAPPHGGALPGYCQARQATGVLDPLKAKVLLLRQGDEQVALVACDLIGMAAPVVERLRAAVAQAGNPAPLKVWVHCTHTHTGGL